MKTLFLAAGPISWASSRLRAFWPAAYIDGATATDDRDITLDGYDVVVFQKIMDIHRAKELRGRGVRVFWDVCDPVWWFDPDGSRMVLDVVDGVTCSNENLRISLSRWCNNKVKSYTVPDRLEWSAYPKQRQHGESDPVRFIWFGFSLNRIGLLGGLAFLERLACNGHNISLTIFDDEPGATWENARFPVYHAKWGLEQENAVIASHDIAILPPYPGPWGIVKSNNRTLTAWACGLPVVDGMDYQDMEALVTNWKHRQAAGVAGYGRFCNEYTVDKSAAEWEKILCVS